jgi:hypothetical protein
MKALAELVEGNSIPRFHENVIYDINILNGLAQQWHVWF